MVGIIGTPEVDKPETPPFIGEPWTPETWYEWCSTLLWLQWERPIDSEWDTFRADWFRDLWHKGRDMLKLPDKNL